MDPRSPARRLGELVGGKYRIGRFMAEGGMGVVYEAHHAIVKRRFAVKFLRPDFAQRREILTRFQREAEAAGAIESENIAAAVDFGIAEDGSPYIVMEYLVGENLAALLHREHRLPLERAADLCAQACRGMEAAHASGIVHRDLKPENLFICRREDGTDLLKVLDFGIAKLEQIDSNNAATRTGTMLGTPAYMSPEQARGEKTIGPRSDVYGLGAILFEMLSGRKPHPGDSHNAILHHISTQPAVPLDAVQAGLPAQLVAAVEGALASDPSARPRSVEMFAQTLAPFAKRVVWPAARPDDSGSSAAGTSSTELAPVAPPPGAPEGDHSPTISTISASSGARRPTGRPWRAVVVPGVAVVVLAAVAIAISSSHRAPKTPPGPTGDRTLAKETRFFVPPPNAGAVQQIGALIKAKAFVDAAALTAMEATPQAVWLIGGSPAEVQSTVQNTMVRAAPDHRVPVFAVNNIPFRDCAQYSAGGVTDTAAYQAWIDGVAAGIGNARAVVILEPDSLGIIPYNKAIDGTPEWCKPTVTNAQNQVVPAPGATPAERYAQLNYAVDTIAGKAPNAAIYLDGTHIAWLGVGEAANRLVKAGVRRAQGFFVNVSNFQPTAQSIQYSTWISKCIYYAANPADGGRRLGRFGDCTSQYRPADVNDYGTWDKTEKWYVDNVDKASNPPSGPAALTHFVIDTGRNGRGPDNASRFAASPHNQPADVIKSLAGGLWCNPPGAGLGQRPTANTGAPLVDAYLWVKVPGASDGSCDIAGGARAWDYARYNPWGITGDAQKHFDMLWDTVDPAAGEWFPEQALQLARNANPPLDADRARVDDALPRDIVIRQAPVAPKNAGAVGAVAATATGPTAPDLGSPPPSLSLSRRPVRPRGRPGGRPADAPAKPTAAQSSPPAASAPTESRAPHATFDPQNPYGSP